MIFSCIFTNRLLQIEKSNYRTLNKFWAHSIVCSLAMVAYNSQTISFKQAVLAIGDQPIREIRKNVKQMLVLHWSRKRKYQIQQHMRDVVR